MFLFLEPRPSLLSRWGRDRSGAVSMLMGFVIVVLIGVVGLSVDYGRAHASRTQLQSAVDAAALAGAIHPSSEIDDIKAAATRQFATNFPRSGVSLDVLFEGGAIRVTAGHTQQNAFLPLLGFNETPVEVTAVVPRVRGKAEVVLVLDYSDSMNDNNKYVRMRDAAKEMVDVISDNGRNDEVKFALVPFAAMVYADLPVGNVRDDINPAWSGTGCTQDRRHPFNTQTSAPAGANDSRWGETKGYYAGAHDPSHVECDLYAVNDLKVRPLTNGFGDVKDQLDRMLPAKLTHIALGAEFGMHVLDPGEPFTGAASFNDDDILKVMVLLTDGMQTATGWGPAGSESTDEAESNLLTICSSLKSKNVLVYTIGYDLTDTHTLDLLSNCATPGQFFRAEEAGNDLKNTFVAISKHIRSTMIRLTM